MCYMGFKMCGKVTSAECLPYLTIVLQTCEAFFNQFPDLPGL